MIFYTTKEQEELLDERYNLKIEIKKKELVERKRKTGLIEKFTAYAYISKDERVFYNIKSQLYLDINGTKHSHLNMNLEPDELGQIYKTDSDFDSKVDEFLSQYKNWKITFYPSKKDGCVQYASSSDSDTPAQLESLDDENSNITIILEDEDKYDICCG